MNKNILIKAASLTLVAGVLLTSFGCKKGDEDTTTTAPAVNIKEEIVQPSFENNTAVIQYPSEKDEGTIETYTKVIEESSYPLIMDIGDTLDKMNDKQKERFLQTYEAYGISKEEAQEMVKAGSTWATFDYMFPITNTTSKCAAFRMIEVSNTDNLRIYKELDCEHGLNPGGTTQVIVSGLVDTSKLETEEDILAELETAGVKVVYTTLAQSGDSVDDWSKVTTAYMPVKF